MLFRSAKISGKIFAGPVVSNGNNDLTVKAYDNTGKEIGLAQANNDGSYSLNIDKTYKGVVLLKAFDKDSTNTNNPQHLDESTQANKTLPTLTASFYFDGLDAIVNITSLTMAAAIKAGFKAFKADGTPDTQSPPSQTSVESANALMAKAFGLKDPLLSQEVIPTVDATGKTNPNANAYGVALDLLSHLVNTQKTPSTEAMAASLAQNLTLDKDGKFQVTSNLPVDLNQAANSEIGRAHV